MNCQNISNWSPDMDQVCKKRGLSFCSIWVGGYNLPEEVDVVGAYGTFTVSEYLDHVGNIADIVMERSLF